MINLKITKYEWNEMITQRKCTCQHDPAPVGASIEKYKCIECGGIADGWYWPELQ